MTRLLSLLLLLSLYSPAAAQLTWPVREHELHASAADAEVKARYAFANNSDHSITIKNITTSCGCTTAELDQKTYQPGESGEITATFTIGDRVGEQNKTIVVQTDDPTESTILLRLKVHVPQLVEITPKYLTWQAGEEAAAKVLHIKILTEDQPVHITSATADDAEAFETKVEEIKAGKSYAIHVTPKSLRSETLTRIQIHTDFPTDKPKTFTAYARIQPSTQSATTPIE